jgi:hypothetical protein
VREYEEQLKRGRGPSKGKAKAKGGKGRGGKQQAAEEGLDAASAGAGVQIRPKRRLPVSRVLLVGGATRMPAVRRFVRHMTGLEAEEEVVDPDLVGSTPSPYCLLPWCLTALACPCAWPLASTPFHPPNRAMHVSCCLCSPCHWLGPVGVGLPLNCVHLTERFSWEACGRRRVASAPKGTMLLPWPGERIAHTHPVGQQRLRREPMGLHS